MSERRLPVRPDLKQLRNQAKDLLRTIRARTKGHWRICNSFILIHPSQSAKLADAQLVLARSYQASSWPRIVQCCNLIDAIWNDDVETVRKLVTENPNLLVENAGIRNNNWGPPLSYAANLGRDRIIEMLHQLGATDLRPAIGRAVLQGRIDTARKLHKMMGSPRPPRGSLGGPAYTLSVSGTALLFELGVEMLDEQGNPDAPVDVVLDSDSRKPEAKHQILEMYAANGFALPDTPMMALHRGRIDLLERHLREDPSLMERTFSYAEIFPPELKCGKEELPRTTMHGATLLHVCVEFDEFEIARWLLDQGMGADVPAAVDANGFGGYTALFGAVVSYPNFWMNYTGGWAHSRKPKAAPFAELLLDRGANPNARASMREKVGDVYREHRDLTPIGWGKVFHNKIVVSEPAMELIAARGGHE